jgi:hypothetical protein
MRLKRWLGFEADVLFSPLPIAECVGRLRDVVESEWAFFGKSQVVGHVGEGSFRLRKRLSSGTYNSFQTYVSGRLSRDGDTTRINCRFGMRWFVTLFTALWLSPFVLMLISSLADSLMVGRVPDLETVIVPLVFGTFGTLVLSIGRIMAGGERRFLLDFLQQTIGARQHYADRNAAIEDLWRNA